MVKRGGRALINRTLIDDFFFLFFFPSFFFLLSLKNSTFHVSSLKKNGE